VTGPGSGLDWDDIVAAATVGTDVRAIALGELPGPAAAHSGVVAGDDPAAAVLDAAALVGAARRAGRPLPTVAHDPAQVPAAGPETARELSLRAGSLLARRAVANDPLLLVTLLESAATAGRLVPPPYLPALMEVATRTRAVRRALVPLLGRRGAWLGALRAEWAWAAGTGPSGAGAGTSVWEHGERAERVEALAALRAREPDTARDLLVQAWPGLRGDRAPFVAPLATGLSLRDQPFLESLLDDERASVREAAIPLLAALPGSAYQRRAAERAGQLLQVRRSVLGRRIVATPPRVDAVAERDGIPAGEIPALTAAVAAAPLATWPQTMGIEPATLTKLPVEGGLAMAVHAAWRAAAVREGEQRWLTALLAATPELLERGAQFPPRLWPPDTALSAALAPAARSERVAGLLRRDRDQAVSAETVSELAACPRPWPEPLAAAVLAQLAVQSGRGHVVPSSVRELLRLAGAGLPTGAVEAVEGLAHRAPPPTTWPALLRSLATTVSIRRTFSKEL
jgi:hypothetical protein